MKQELIEKAKKAKSAEELLEIAKAEGIELTDENAAELYARLEMPPEGELSDDDLEDVSGGGCGGSSAPKAPVQITVVGKKLWRRCGKCGNDCWDSTCAASSGDLFHPKYRCYCAVCRKTNTPDGDVIIFDGGEFDRAPVERVTIIV